MANVKFFRGLKAKFNSGTHQDGLYFATDTHELLVNGEAYGKTGIDSLNFNAEAQGDKTINVKVDFTKNDGGVGSASVATGLINKAYLDGIIGKASGVASLDSEGKVPASQLPSYVDDVVEYESKAKFPATGETGKIYVAQDKNLTYRWSGSAYVEISASLALGETSSTAYAGNKGKANAQAIASLQIDLNSLGESFSTRIGNYTLGKSVPSNAVFTDQSTTQDGHYAPATEDTSKKKTASGATGTAGATVQVIKAIKLDSKGHVVGIESAAATDSVFDPTTINNAISAINTSLETLEWQEVS